MYLCMFEYLQIHVCILVCRSTQLHPYIHTYIHPYIHTYTLPQLKAASIYSMQKKSILYCMHTYVHVHIYIYTCIIDIQNGCSAVRIQATAASFWSSIASTWTSVATCAVTAPSTGISCGSAAGSSSQVPERQYKKWSWLMNKRYNRLTQIHHWSQIRSYFPQYEVSWSFLFFAAGAVRRPRGLAHCHQRLVLHRDLLLGEKHKKYGHCQSQSPKFGSCLG